MNGFARLPGLLDKARGSTGWRWLLNLLLGRLIPFNRPHGVRIFSLDAERVQTIAPNRRRNQNHLRGIHACCIATVAEFSSGLMLLSRLDPARYRLIMAGLEVDYHYQAKTAIVATTCLTETELQTLVLGPLGDKEKIQATLVTEIDDRQGQRIATARITWQIKSWEQVRTRPV